MNDVASVATPITLAPKNETGKSNNPKIIAIKVDSEPDSFTPEVKISAQGYAAAGAGALCAGKGIYTLAKLGIEKLIGGAEKEIGSFMQELGKEFKGIPNGIKTSAKYGGAFVAAAGVAALVFKDSDKDGKLDILEAAQKFVTPDE